MSLRYVVGEQHRDKIILVIAPNRSTQEQLSLLTVLLERLLFHFFQYYIMLLLTVWSIEKIIRTYGKISH